MKQEINTKVLPNGAIEVSRPSVYSGKINSITITGIPPEVFSRRLVHWQSEGGLVQDVFHMLTAAEREFLISGLTDDEWDAAMGPER